MDTPVMSTDDEARVRTYVLDTFALWGDAEAYAARFAPVSDYVAFDGTRHRGPRENVALHRELFDGVLYGTRIVGEVESVRAVGADVAVVHAIGGVVWPWHRTIPASRLSRQTLVLARHDGAWTITAFHNTRVAPVRPPPAWLGRLFRAWTRLRAGTGRPRALGAMNG